MRVAAINRFFGSRCYLYYYMLPVTNPNIWLVDAGLIMIGL